MAHGERSPRRSLDSCVALTCDKSRLSRPIEAGQPGRQSGGRTSLSHVCPPSGTEPPAPSSLVGAKRPPGLQYGSGGPGTDLRQVRGRCIARRGSTCAQFRKFVCIKLNSAGNPGSQVAREKTSAVFNLIQIHSRYERKLLPIRALSQGDRTRFNSCFSDLRRKRGVLGLRRANRREGECYARSAIA